ncbi:restriction endonuclease subunit S [Burkholderia sp. Ac-20365]|uniref:restriction endonuclease subunit S n=1 Tax=Burkholderia sp. Ac-20365 TaxID=2703897 RepID=UPI00197BEAB3|nr:restriction endonuclease subunit S [Burkholderia sp. Ac-20365]MBN3759879.1 restriction endonuclease subunit S [Burkholderia sp. Ac-20365]
MSFDWSSGKLGDFIELKRGYDLPQAKRQPGAVPLVSSSGVSDRHNVAMVKGPGVVTGRYGTIGQVFFIEEDFWPLNTTLYVRNFKGNDPKFIHYFLKTVDFFAYSDKAAVPGVNRNHLHEALATIPPLAVQKGIAGILGSLDDRITLLRETNASLESIAQALFKSWFVDFDPVRAKQEGRTPQGMDDAKAALFPNGFDDSELGVVPRGWRVSTLADVSANCGGAIQTGPFGSQLHASDYVESGIPVVMPKDIQRRRVDAGTTARIRSEDADRLERHKLKPGDIVFSRRGDVERHALIGEREVGWLCGTGCLLVRPGPSFQSSSFLSMTLDAPRARQWLVRHAVGATMPNLNTSILGSVPVVIPDTKVLEVFEETISTTEARLSQNSEVANTLSSIRDMLIPRLISGQLRLSEAEALVA